MARTSQRYWAWLHNDARNRVLRTLLQGAVAVLVIPAADAVVQVVQGALADAVTGHGFDWRQVAVSAGLAAGTAVTMAVAAYLHRVKLDPSGIPSAAPPPQPVGPASPASSDLPQSRSAAPPAPLEWTQPPPKG